MTIRRHGTRMRLLDAATQVFAEMGVQGASVEAICTRADFTRGAFYSNFSSKEELFAAVLEREFQRRTEDFTEKAEELAPRLRESSDALGAPEAARIITEFFMPQDDATAWQILETEYLLMKMRDPATAAGHVAFTMSFVNGLSDTVHSVLVAAGRESTIPLDRMITVLSNQYEYALKITALAGPDAPGGLSGLGETLAELVFALTRTRA